jgi:hypothetical protein
MVSGSKKYTLTVFFKSLNGFTKSGYPGSGIGPAIEKEKVIRVLFTQQRLIDQRNLYHYLPERQISKKA